MPIFNIQNIVSISFCWKEQEFLGEVFDPKSRARTVQDEPGTSSHIRKLKDYCHLLGLFQKSVWAMLGVPLTSPKFHDLLGSLISHYIQLYFITMKW